MGRNQLLLVAALLGAVGSAVSVPSIALAGPACTYADYSSGVCNINGQINGGGVDLSGHDGDPGSGPTSGAGAGNASGGGGKSKPVAPVCQGVPEACQKFTVIAPGAPGNPAVTIDDLKNFPAVPGTDHMEPNGWMIVGLDTNFYSIVGVEVVNGTLLGRPASVRFTPVSWHWTYGDGASATRSTPGSTWAAQGAAEFDPTATSHVYTAAGTYFIDLSITFSAEYQYAGGTWRPVIGTITLPANRLEASAGDAKTVLVNRDCSQNPGGPGC
jgi:hypothetical protein